MLLLAIKIGLEFFFMSIVLFIFKKMLLLCKMLIFVRYYWPCCHYGAIHVRVIPQVAQASEYEYLFHIVSVLHSRSVMISIGKRDPSIVMNLYE